MTPGVDLRASGNMAVRQVVDRIMGAVLCLAAVVALFPLVLVLGFIIVNGAAAINLDILTRLPMPVGELGGGMANAFLGTFVLVLVAAAIGVPIGVLAGIYLAEFGHNRFGATLRFLTDVLTGVPSIIIGITAYTLIVLPMHHFSAFAGGVALALLMIPVITRTTEEALKRVPPSLREASLALGVHEWRTIVSVVLPAGLGGIVTGIMLAVARVSGETAPLLFTAFGSHFWPDGLGEPIAAVPLQVFQYAVAPYQDWQDQAWAAAFVLMVLILGVNVAVRVLTKSGFRRVQ